MAEAKRDQDKIFSFDTDAAEREGGGMSFPMEGGTEIDPPASDVDGALAEIAKLKAEKEELTQTLMRRQADFENFRKRTERDRHEEARRGVERLVTDLIPVLDGFDRALKGHDDPAYEEYRKGVNIIRKQLFDMLTKHGVQRIEAAGKMFDPHVHQAIERVQSSELPDGQIVEVFQDGYSFHGRVLRPAIVRVVVNSEETADSSAS